MDTSETYRKMRIAAIPDLGMGVPPELIPNVEVTWVTPFVFIDRVGNYYYSQIDRPLPELMTCQLERQDQLQAMVGLIDRVTHHYQDLERHFYEWIRRHEYRWIHYTATAEQLWLAFVQHELHGKVWDGEKWQ